MERAEASVGGGGACDFPENTSFENRPLPGSQEEEDGNSPDATEKIRIELIVRKTAKLVFVIVEIVIPLSSSNVCAFKHRQKIFC